MRHFKSPKTLSMDTSGDAGSTSVEESGGDDRDDARICTRRRRQSEKAAAPAEHAVAILEKLTSADPSYSYGLACALALQARLHPTPPGPRSAAVAASRRPWRPASTTFTIWNTTNTSIRSVPVRTYRMLFTLRGKAWSQVAAPVVAVN